MIAIESVRRTPNKISTTKAGAANNAKPVAPSIREVATSTLFDDSIFVFMHSLYRHTKRSRNLANNNQLLIFGKDSQKLNACKVNKKIPSFMQQCTLTTAEQL